MVLVRSDTIRVSSTFFRVPLMSRHGSRLKPVFTPSSHLCHMTSVVTSLVRFTWDNVRVFVLYSCPWITESHWVTFSHFPWPPSIRFEDWTFNCSVHSPLYVLFGLVLSVLGSRDTPRSIICWFPGSMVGKWVNRQETRVFNHSYILDVRQSVYGQKKVLRCPCIGHGPDDNLRETLRRLLCIFRIPVFDRY